MCCGLDLFVQVMATDKPVATNRPRYRSGRKETAVKAFTLNQESKFLIIKNVPALGAQEELMKLFALYGTIVEYRLLDEEEAAEYTDVYWIKFAKVEEARVAKKKCDDYNFFGHLLDVAYAPQFEAVSDMREKLEERKRVVARKLRQNYNDAAGRPGEQKERTGRIAHEDMPFEAPPDYQQTNLEALPMPQYLNASSQLYKQTRPLHGGAPPPPRPLDGSEAPAPPIISAQKAASRIPAQVPGQPMVSSYYGDNSVKASVLNIRNKLKRLSEPVLPTGEPQMQQKPAQRRRI